MKNKPILLVPMAGLGKRFRDKGFVVPKPFIVVDDKQIIDYSLESIDLSEYSKIIFVVLKEHVVDFGIDKILFNKYGQDIEIVIVDQLTKGSVCSCLAASHLIDNDTPLVIHTLDIHFRPVFHVSDVPQDSDGFLLTFHSNSPNYSYARTEGSRVVETKEKQVISQNAIVGIYYFCSGKTFVNYARKMVNMGFTQSNEYYIAPLYNLLIENGLNIRHKEVDLMHVIGTPDELSFFQRNVASRNKNLPIALCADHSGRELKELTKKVLENLNIKFVDFGCYSDKDCDYSDYIFQACAHVQKGFCGMAFGFCRSGQGVNITANKVKGMRAALIINPKMARLAVEHNCANFFSFPASLTSVNDMYAFIPEIMNAQFKGGRHSQRIQKIESYENQNK